MRKLFSVLTAGTALLAAASFASAISSPQFCSNYVTVAPGATSAPIVGNCPTSGEKALSGAFLENIVGGGYRFETLDESSIAFGIFLVNESRDNQRAKGADPTSVRIQKFSKTTDVTIDDGLDTGRFFFEGFGLTVGVVLAIAVLEERRLRRHEDKEED